MPLVMKSIDAFLNDFKTELFILIAANNKGFTLTLTLSDVWQTKEGSILCLPLLTSLLTEEGTNSYPTTFAIPVSFSTLFTRNFRLIFCFLISFVSVIKLIERVFPTIMPGSATKVSPMTKSLNISGETMLYHFFFMPFANALAAFGFSSLAAFSSGFFSSGIFI